MLLVDKIRGVLLIILGVAWIIFIYRFDALTDEPTHFGTKAFIGFAIGIVAVINGIRIYRRK